MKNTISTLALSTIFSVLLISLIGCASNSKSSIKINSDNLYSITVAEDIIEAKDIAYNEANNECEKQNMKAIIVNESAVPKRYSVYEFTFKCVDK